MKDLFVYFDVAVDDAGPVKDDICEVGAKFLKVDVAPLAHIH